MKYIQLLILFLIINPVESCRDEYLTKKGLENHELRGDHHLLPLKQTLDERSYDIFYKYTTGVKTQHDTFVDSFLSLDDFTTNEYEIPDEGWALKKTSSRTKYTKEMEDFLQNQYTYFKNSGQRRVDAYAVQKLMRASRTPLFQANERLTASQLASYFSTRQKKKITKQQKNDTPHLSEADENKIREESFTEMSTDPSFSRRYQNEPTYFDEGEDVLQHIISKSQESNVGRNYVLPDEDE